MESKSDHTDTPLNETTGTLEIRPDVASQSIILHIPGELSMYIHMDDLPRFTAKLMRAIEALEEA